MKRRHFLCTAIAVLVAATGHAQPIESRNLAKRNPDLADAVAGVYFGDVVSDSIGSSQSGVTLTVTRVGKNQVQISSDYPRLPIVVVPLTQAMHTIVQARGSTVFYLNRSEDAQRLDVSFNHEVTWAGRRR